MSGLKAFHLAAFFSVLVSGLAFLAMLLYLTADIQWQRACLKVVRRLLKTVAIRQVMGILAAMTFVRFGLEPLVKVLRRLFRAQGVWEKSSEFYILREVRPQSSWGQGAPWLTSGQLFFQGPLNLRAGCASWVVHCLCSTTSGVTRDATRRDCNLMWQRELHVVC